MYRFDWATPVFGGQLGACHALEIPFVFNNLEAAGSDMFVGGAATRDARDGPDDAHGVAHVCSHGNAG